jgi:hypothetical protein
MKKLTLICWLVFFVSFSTQANAQLSAFAGQWKNVDAGTDGLSKIEIVVDGVAVSTEAFGNCSPTDCPFGSTNALAYAPNVSDDIVLKASALTADYDFGFAQVRLVIHRMGRNRIRIETFSHFKDGSARTDVHTFDTMRRLRKDEAF